MKTGNWFGAANIEAASRAFLSPLDQTDDAERTTSVFAKAPVRRRPSSDRRQSVISVAGSISTSGWVIKTSRAKGSLWKQYWSLGSK